MAKYRLTDSFPINKFQTGRDDVVVNNRAEYSVGFRLHLKEVFTLQESDYFEIDRILEAVLKRLPHHTIAHFQFRYRKIPYTEKDFGKFEKERYGIYKAFKFLERAIIKDEAYVFFTKTGPSVRKRTKGLSLLHKNLVPQELIDPKISEDFYNAMSSVEDVLKNSGYFIVKRLRKKDYFDGERSNGILADYFSLKTTAAGKTGFDDIEFGGKIKIGNRYASISGVEGLGDFPEFLTPIRNAPKIGASLSCTFGLGLGLRFDHIVNHYIFLDDPKQVSREMQAKRNMLSNFATVSAENRANYEGVATFVEALAKHGRIPVRYHMNVLNIADSEAELVGQDVDIQSAMTEIGFRARINHADKAEIFWAGCPGNAGDLPHLYTSTLLLDQVVSLVQKEGAYRNSISDFGVILCDRITGYPLNVDFIFEPKRLGIIANYNAFTIGPSGSGKSFMTNTVLRSLYYAGNHVVIVDMGRSYEKFCEEAGGKYIDPTSGAFPGYNPFLIGEDEVTDERIELIAKLVFTIWYQEEGRPGKETEEILKQHIEEYFSGVFREGVFPCFSTFYDFMGEKHAHISQLMAKEVNNELTAIVAKGFFDFDSFSIVLKKYARGGRLEKLLNATEVLDLTNDSLVVFEIENIKDSPTLMNLQVLMIMDVFLSKLLRLGEGHPTLKTLLIEEAWKSMMNENMASFLKYSVKTFRKYKGQLNTVTQELDDLLGNPIVKNSIVNSSPIKILMDPGSYREQIDTVADMLSLTAYQKKLYTSLNRNNDPNGRYREVLILTGPMAMVYRVEVSDYEYAMFTTDAEEVQRIRELKKSNGGDMVRAMVDFAERTAEKRLEKQQTT